MAVGVAAQDGLSSGQRADRRRGAPVCDGSRDAVGSAVLLLTATAAGRPLLGPGPAEARLAPQLLGLPVRSRD